jgi:hypothetical protein
MRSRRRKDSGYVLLLVLLVLVMAGTVLAGASRLSCAKAMAANQVQRELQLRWGVRSINELCLPAAEQLLCAEAETEGRAAATAGYTVNLGGIRFGLLLSDEQSKINVNHLAVGGDEGELYEAIRRLQLFATRPLSLAPRARRVRTSLVQRSEALFGAYDQVLSYDHPSQLVDINSPRNSAIAALTCWGDGTVNFKRASITVLEMRLKGLLDYAEVNDLVGFVLNQPDCTLNEAVKYVELRAEKAAAVQAALTDQSNCYSLWVVARGRRRKWHYLSIVDRDGDIDGDKRWRFAWP